MTADPIAAEVRQVSDIVPEAVQDYIDGIAPERRALFDRIHQLILQARPGVEVALSYKMPTYQAGRRRLYVGAYGNTASRSTAGGRIATAVSAPATPSW